MSTSDSEDAPTFRRPKVILPVPTPSPKVQHVQAGVPDTQLTREATGLLREFSTPLLFNHSHRVFFWAAELGRAAFHDLGLLETFRRRRAMQRRVAILGWAGLGGLCGALLLHGLGAAQAPQTQPPSGKTYFPV